jgi:hypothetical protein
MGVELVGVMGHHPPLSAIPTASFTPRSATFFSPFLSLNACP